LVPKSWRGPKAFTERSNMSTRFSYLADDIVLSSRVLPRAASPRNHGSDGRG
jgi:hypothetical protein